MADDETEIVTLLSSDHEEFKVERAVAEKSEAIRCIIAETSVDSPVPLMNVKAKILKKVLQFCKFEVDANTKNGEKCNMSADEMKQFHKEFVDVDLSTLFDLILSANFLNISSLLNLTCSAVADQIKGKSPEQIREKFGIENDFTPEEEEQVRRENQWAFE